MNTRNSRLKHRMACNGVKYTAPENSVLIMNVNEDVRFGELLLIKMRCISVVGSHCLCNKVESFIKK